MKKNLLLPLIILSAFLISACAEEDTGVRSIEPEISAEGTYLIANASNLAWFDNKTLAKNVILTNDIDMGNQPFSGIDNIIGDITIDGDNHSIFNLKLEDTVSDYAGVALIQEVADTAKLTIKNLHLKDGTVNSVDDDMMFGASFVADVAGGDVTLDNVSSNLVVFATTYAGGFIGKITNSKSIIIDHSSNKGNVSCGTSHAGGLIGIASSTDNSFVITIDNSSNEGSVTSGTTDYYASGGGLVGNIQTINTINIINSHNKGSVSSDNSNNNIAGLVGGIETSAQIVNIDKSYNTGIIKSLGSAGGFIAGNNNTIKTTITNSFNSGDVEGTFGIGGLLGGTSGPTIRTSYNSGKITTKAPSPAYDNGFAGGLIGSVTKQDVLQDNVIIANSYNVGVIESNSAGGYIDLNDPNKNYDYNSYSGGLIGKASTLYAVGSFSMAITSSYSYTDMIAVTESASTPVTTPIVGIIEEKETPAYPLTVTATDNFYYSKVGLTDGSYATLKSDVDFKDKTTFGGNWDFNNTWDMIEGNLYPTLRNVVKPND